MSRTVELAAYASALRYESLPRAAVDAARRVTMDLLGVALAGVGYPVPTAMARYVADSGGSGGATAWGQGFRTSTAAAALLNGTLAADMELDDVHPLANLHASSVFVPALLAVAETVDVSGREWIAALTAAYEVGCRVSLALGDTGQTDRGFHPTAVSGTFGAAAGVGRLLGLPAESMSETLGLAGCQAAGTLLWRTEPAHYAKSFQSGMAARSAVTAGELVRTGFHGPLDALDGRVNVLAAFSDVGNPDALTEGLGAQYAISGTGYKFYTCCRAIHAPLEILFELIETNELREEDIESIEVWLPPHMIPVVDHNELVTHDLQYIMAVAVRDGEIGRAQTTPSRREDPTLSALVQKVALRADPRLPEAPHWPARVRIRTVGGELLEGRITDPKGNPGNPASDEELESKFRRMTQPDYGESVTEQLLTTLAKLEELTSMRELTALLGGAGGTGKAGRAA